jgi:hypothetical protein
LLCSLVVIPAALAAPRATGDGVLELQNVYGKVNIGSAALPAKGTLWGQMDSGAIQATDPIAGDGQILVSGWDTKALVPSLDPTAPRTYVYKGLNNMRFRVTGGRYKLVFNGSNINMTAVGVGVAWLSGSVKATDPGSFAVDSGDWQDVPYATDPTAPLRVPFGVQPTTSGP